MAIAVQAGEGGGPADVHAVAQRAVRRGSESGRVPHGKISSHRDTDVQLDFKTKLSVDLGSYYKTKLVKLKATAKS